MHNYHAAANYALCIMHYALYMMQSYNFLSKWQSSCQKNNCRKYL